jgi:hypothetical protein
VTAGLTGLGIVTATVEGTPVVVVRSWRPCASLLHRRRHRTLHHTLHQHPGRQAARQTPHKGTTPTAALGTRVGTAVGNRRRRRATALRRMERRTPHHHSTLQHLRSTLPHHHSIHQRRRRTHTERPRLRCYRRVPTAVRRRPAVDQGPHMAQLTASGSESANANGLGVGQEEVVVAAVVVAAVVGVQVQVQVVRPGVVTGTRAVVAVGGVAGTAASSTARAVLVAPRATSSTIARTLRRRASFRRAMRERRTHREARSSFSASIER